MNDSEKAMQGSTQPAEGIPKRKSFKKFIIPLVASAIIFTSVFGIVYAKKKFKDGPHGFIIERLTENLNLTENQKVQVEKLKAQVKEKMESNKPDRENGMEELANEFKKDQLDKSKLMEFANKKHARMKETKEFMMDRLVEFHSILTHEQRSKVVENISDMKHKFHDGMDKHKDKQNKRD